MTVLLLAVLASSCSVPLPQATDPAEDPRLCLIRTREALDRGDAAGALAWAERGIAVDPALEWPELRRDAARAALDLGGGDFPRLLDAAAWVVEGGGAGKTPPRLPSWPGSPGSGGGGLGEGARALLESLEWGRVEQAAVHLESLVDALDGGRIPQSRLAGDRSDFYLSHSALRLATGLVLLFDRNADLSDGLQPRAAEPDSAGSGRKADPPPRGSEEASRVDLQRSLRSAESLVGIESLEPYVDAVRAIVNWVDEAVAPGRDREKEEPASEEPPETAAGPASRALGWLWDRICPAARASGLPVRGRLEAPLVAPLDSSPAGSQPAASPGQEGWRIQAGIAAWTEGTVSAIDAFLDARVILEGVEEAPLADQLHGAAEASRRIAGKRAVARFAPVRIGRRAGAWSAEAAPVLEGVGSASTGLLGSPEGWGSERIGLDLRLARRWDRLFLDRLAAGAAVAARPRWARDTHLLTFPEPSSSRGGWAPSGEVDLLLGLLFGDRAGGWRAGALLDCPVAGEDRIRDPDGLWSRSPILEGAVEAPGPGLGPVALRLIAAAAIDRDRAEGSAGAALSWRSAGGTLLRRDAGWEGELRVGFVGLATRFERTPGGAPVRCYRLELSRLAAGVPLDAAEGTTFSPGSSGLSRPAR